VKILILSTKVDISEMKTNYWTQRIDDVVFDVAVDPKHPHIEALGINKLHTTKLKHGHPITRLERHVALLRLADALRKESNAVISVNLKRMVSIDFPFAYFTNTLITGQDIPKHAKNKGHVVSARVKNCECSFQEFIEGCDKCRGLQFNNIVIVNQHYYNSADEMMLMILSGRCSFIYVVGMDFKQTTAKFFDGEVKYDIARDGVVWTTVRELDQKPTKYSHPVPEWIDKGAIRNFKGKTYKLQIDELTVGHQCTHVWRVGVASMNFDGAADRLVVREFSSERRLRVQEYARAKRLKPVMCMYRQCNGTFYDKRQKKDIKCHRLHMPDIAKVFNTDGVKLCHHRVCSCGACHDFVQICGELRELKKDNASPSLGQRIKSVVAKLGPTKPPCSLKEPLLNGDDMSADVEVETESSYTPPKKDVDSTETGGTLSEQATATELLHTVVTPPLLAEDYAPFNFDLECIFQLPAAPQLEKEQKVNGSEANVESSESRSSTVKLSDNSCLLRHQEEEEEKKEEIVVTSTDTESESINAVRAKNPDVESDAPAVSVKAIRAPSPAPSTASTANAELFDYYPFYFVRPIDRQSSSDEEVPSWISSDKSVDDTKVAVQNPDRYVIDAFLADGADVKYPLVVDEIGTAVYHSTPAVNRKHNGQRKLEVVERRFLDRVRRSKKKLTIVYVGCSPGHHLKKLVSEYSEFRFVCYDTRDLKFAALNVLFLKHSFTDIDAKYWENRPHALISDIRDLSYERGEKTKIAADQRLQWSWIQIMTPLFYLVKFRPDVEPQLALGSEIWPQVFGRIDSLETRVFGYCLNKKVMKLNINPAQVIGKLHYFNAYMREIEGFEENYARFVNPQERELHHKIDAFIAQPLADNTQNVCEYKEDDYDPNALRGGGRNRPICMDHDCKISGDIDISETDDDDGSCCVDEEKKEQVEIVVHSPITLDDNKTPEEGVEFVFVDIRDNNMYKHIIPCRSGFRARSSKISEWHIPDLRCLHFVREEEEEIDGAPVAVYTYGEAHHAFMYSATLHQKGVSLLNSRVSTVLRKSNTQATQYESFLSAVSMFITTDVRGLKGWISTIMGDHEVYACMYSSAERSGQVYIAQGIEETAAVMAKFSNLTKTAANLVSVISANKRIYSELWTASRWYAIMYKQALCKDKDKVVMLNGREERMISAAAHCVTLDHTPTNYCLCRKEKYVMHLGTFEESIAYKDHTQYTSLLESIVGKADVYIYKKKPVGQFWTMVLIVSIMLLLLAAMIVMYTVHLGIVGKVVGSILGIIILLFFLWGVCVLAFWSQEDTRYAERAKRARAKEDPATLAVPVPQSRRSGTRRVRVLKGQLHV